MSLAEALSVIVASRNRPALLVDAVQSVLALADRPGEIIVIDQSERANPAMLALSESESPVVYVHRPGRGVARARNEGASLARQRYIAFIDDDVLVVDDWARCMVRALNAGSGGRRAVSGRVLPGTPEPGGGYAPSTVETRDPVVHRTPGSADVLFTGNAGLPAAVFEWIGGFDERLGPGTAYPAAEDNDLGLRLLIAGIDIVYAPEVVVHHRSWRRPAERIPVRLRYGRGQGAFYAKHLPRHRSLIVARIGHDIRRLSRRALTTAPWSPLFAAGDVAYLVGLAAGMVGWTLHVGRSDRGVPGRLARRD